MKLNCYFLFLLCFIQISSFAQENAKFGLVGSYQQFNQPAVSFGILFQSEAQWPKLNFKSNYESKLRGHYYFNNTSNDKIIGFRCSFYRSTKYIGIGFDGMHLFQGKSHRLDIGPAIKVGYKYFWLEYSVTFSLGDNIYTNNPNLNPVNINRVNHNLGICITVPLIDLKI